MFEQLVPAALQRRHWRANEVGLPIHAPLLTDSVFPWVVLPAIAGNVVFDGGTGSSAKPVVENGPTVPSSPPIASRDPNRASALTLPFTFGSQLASAAPVPVVASLAIPLRVCPPIEL